MKRFMHKYLSVLLAAFTLLWACTPEEFTLDEVVSATELNKASVTQNPEDPNMVILESTNPGMTPLWTTPQGRSQRVVDTVRIPFAGEYEFYYGVLAAGGFVAVDTVQLEITTNNFDYINDPLWELLTGGVGESKTWLLDLDGEGVSRYFAGPQYFYGTDMGWLEGGDGGCYGDDCWNWNPDWPGNTWVADQGDYGSMTFDLIDGAHLTANHLMIPGRGEESGVFFLDADAKTFSSTDVTPLHSPNTDGCVPKWTEAKVFSLTENTMQLGFLRSADCDGEAMLVFNYISQEYAENWVPEDQPDPEPELPEGWQDDVTSIVSTELKWVLSPETPFNWAGLDGAFLNPWNSAADYPDWTGFTAGAAAGYANFSLTMNSSDNSVVFVAPDGTESTGTYELDEKGVYTFDGVKPEFNIVSWVNLSTTDENQWRITRIEKDDTGKVVGMWVGKRDPEKPEYMVFHLELQVGPADPMDAWKTALAGKTFKPDVNWFVNWVGVGPDFSGGWTSAETFGTDFTSNTWVWTQESYDIAQSASISFTDEGDHLGITVSQSLTTETNTGTNEAPNWVTDSVDPDYSVTGTVNIDTENAILSIDVPLISYAGSSARWLGSEGDSGDWFFVSHGGSNLGNIDTEGLWLGYTTNPGAEVAIYHFVVAE